MNKIHNLKEIKEKGYDHPAGGGGVEKSEQWKLAGAIHVFSM